MPTCSSVKTGKLVCWTLTSLCHSRCPHELDAILFLRPSRHLGVHLGGDPAVCRTHTSVLEKPGSHGSGLLILQPSQCELTSRAVIFRAKKRKPACAAPREKQGTFYHCLWEMATPPPSPAPALYLLMGQEPASALVLPTVLPRSWVLFLLTLFNSKGIPKITPVFPDISSVFYAQNLVVSPYHCPRIVSSLEQELIEQNFEGQRAGHKEWTLRLRRGIDY